MARLAMISLFCTSLMSAPSEILYLIDVPSRPSFEMSIKALTDKDSREFFLSDYVVAEKSGRGQFDYRPNGRDHGLLVSWFENNVIIRWDPIDTSGPRVSIIFDPYKSGEDLVAEIFYIVYDGAKFGKAILGREVKYKSGPIRTLTKSEYEALKAKPGPDCMTWITQMGARG